MIRTYIRAMALLAIICITLSSQKILADDWPQWLGPNRDGKWREKGIVEKFPDGGPVLRWSTPISGGYAGPAVADGRVFVPDFVPANSPKLEKISVNDHYSRASRIGTERLLCLNDKDGSLLWTYKYPVTYKHAKLYANGPRTTPIVDGDHVYILGAQGRLACIQVKDGRERWHRELTKDYKIKAPVWGFATHPIIDGDKIITIVGGSETAVVAFDKLSGKELWRALSCKNPGYAQLAIYKAGGKRQLFAWHGEALNSLNPENGEVYWSSPVKPMYQMTIGMPRIEGRHMFIMSWGCSRVLELSKTTSSPRMVWKAGRKFGVGGKMNVPYLEDGHIYASDADGTYRCVELVSGKRVWESKKVIPKGKVYMGSTFTIKQGSRFFLATELGDLIIAKMTPKGYQEIDRTSIIKQTNVTGGRPVWWSHPAFANRSIYVRNDKVVHCYSLAEK